MDQAPRPLEAASEGPAGLPPAGRKPRWWAGTLGLVLIAALGIGFGAVLAIRIRHQARERAYQTERAAALADLSAGRSALAMRRLTQLATRWPNRPELLFDLGDIEQKRGRPEAAFAWWDRIAPDAPEAARAAARRAEDAMVHGRFTEAEARLRSVLETAPPTAGRFEAREALVRLLRSQGRAIEARRLYLEGASDAPSLVRFLRRLQRLDAEPFATEGMAVYLADARRQSPDDLRVQLALANLALVRGQLDEADRQLADLERRSPGDPAVAAVRLAHARASGRPDLAWQALAALPADPARAAELAAFFAQARKDSRAERAALEAWRAIDPAAVPALTRLAALAAADGQDEEAARLRQQIVEDNRAQARHFELLTAPDMTAAAAELATLCEVLGKPFEALCWRHAASGDRGPRPVPPPPPTGTLADLLRDVPPPSPGSDAIASESLRMPVFTDDAEKAGLAFTQDNGDPGRGMTPPVTSSGGVALLDYDGDGWLDVYCVQGGVFPPPRADAPAGDRLFRNQGDGTFADVSESSGVAALARGYGHGAAVGDIDNDGRPDLFLTRWRAYQLLRNNGDGTFADVTASLGLDGDRDWPTSAAFADLDDDGDLDLYVCHYLKWDVGRLAPCVDPNDPTIFRCQPRDFPSLPDHVFRNDGSRFVDVTTEAGFTDPDGRGLGVLAADADGDGKIDLFVANDTTANYLFRNLGGFRFEEVGAAAGVAANANGGHQAGMGVACADLDGDARLDLLVTNFYDESTTFFRNLGDGLFADQTAAIGLAVPSRYLLGFGIVALDANTDGRLDLMTANGHVHDGRPAYPWTMPVQLLLGTGGGRLVDATSRAGDPFQVPHVGRALASGDLDNDGRCDAVLIAQNEPLVYLHNRTEGGHSVTIALEGTRSNRDGVGAVVTVEAAGRRLVVPRCGGGSYQAAGDPRLHFGLGDAATVDRVEVRWPSGQVDQYIQLPADSGYHLREAAAEPLPLSVLPTPDLTDSSPRR